MKQVILIAHGKLGLEMKNSAEMIFGKLENFSAVEFCREDGLESLKEKINAQISPLSHEVLIFTDLFCGTPYNVGCAICMEDTTKDYEVLSGMSLPLVLETASMLGSASVSEVVEAIQELSQATVQSFKEQVIEVEEDF